ncbi:MAG TPA: cytochrome c biogenesis protein ResB [Pyrinomonadaceae bacterium]|nr:cytochrome c biogenesis protein ResB [Pyrinomonadaceae bacterium]
MAAIEETKSEIGVSRVAPAARPAPSFITRLLNLLSSVRFGVTLLILLAAASMIGMLIMQTNVDGFDKYFAALTPSQKLLGGVLGFFDIYHAWYFNALLLILSLNIVLASIERFPGAWQYVVRPKLDVVAGWLRKQSVTNTLEMRGETREAVVERIKEAAQKTGFKTIVNEKGGRTFLLAQRGTWNRLGAYSVHVALLTIFFGGFMTAKFGRTGSMWMKPGETVKEMSETVFKIEDTSTFRLDKATTALPFEVNCTDIQQKLIRKEGPITADNTIDWLTRIKIKDAAGEHEALVHMNRPYDYCPADSSKIGCAIFGGYRFFQASFMNLGHARNITLRLTPEAGGEPQEVKVARDGSTQLPDGTKIDYVDFQPDFQMQGSQVTTQSGEYNNPAAILNVTTPSGERTRAFAFAQELPSGAPIGRAVAGYKFRLADFEKVPEAHMLSVQRDPGTTIFYVGSALLFVTLAAVFFFSHQRVWAIVEETEGDGKTFQVVLGGNTNRNVVALEDRFKRLVQAITGQPREV